MPDSYLVHAPTVAELHVALAARSDEAQAIILLEAHQISRPDISRIAGLFEELSDRKGSLEKHVSRFRVDVRMIVELRAGIVPSTESKQDAARRRQLERLLCKRFQPEASDACWCTTLQRMRQALVMCVSGAQPRVLHLALRMSLVMAERLVDAMRFCANDPESGAALVLHLCGWSEQRIANALKKSAPWVGCNIEQMHAALRRLQRELP